MIRRFIHILAAVFTIVVFSHPFQCQALAPLYDSQIIEKVEVVVAVPTATSADAKQVLSRIKMKEGVFFSQLEFDQDLKTLAQDYNRIEPSLESINGKMYITLKVWPKPVIRAIEWEGVKSVPLKELQHELDVSIGSVYDRKIFNEGFNKIKQHYVRVGFFEAQITYDVNVDPLTNEATITISVDEGRAGRINKLDFVGFTATEEQDVAAMMCTQPWMFFISKVFGGGVYSEDMVQQDQMVITNYFQNHGYADAKVEIDIVETKVQGRINLRITVTRGDRYRFGKITMEGNTLFTTEQIENCLQIREGCFFSPDVIRDSVGRITDLYGKYGYIDAVIDFDPELEEGQNSYAIHFNISEGEQYRVGLIKVYGNSCTESRIILHETLLVPGEIFNLEKLKKTEERLQNIAYFKNVNVYAVRTDEESLLGECYRDVHIEVEEMSTGNFGAFAGFSDNDSVFGGFNLTEKNFNYRGLDRLFTEGVQAIRGGGEYAALSLSVGSKTRNYSLSWTKPYFRDTNWSIGIDVDRNSNRNISNEYDLESGGFTIFAGKQLNAFLRTSLHYRLRNSDVNLYIGHKKWAIADATPDTLGSIDPHYEKFTPLAKEMFIAQNAASIAELLQMQEASGFVSAVGTSLLYDSTDCIARPTRGCKSRLEVEFAGVGGEKIFFGASYCNSLYYPINESTVIKWRADFRFVTPFAGTTYTTLPLDERLFLGGDNIIRGYRPYRIGPLFVGTDDPSGGLSSQLYSAEISKILWSRMDLFIFFDMGHLSDQKWDFNVKNLRGAAGFGTRIKVYASGPPITLGMGYPINPKNTSEVKRFFFSMGGKF